MSIPENCQPPFTADDVEILNTETPFRGFFRVDKVTLRHRAYEGGWAAPVAREIFVRGEAAAVLPYDPVRQEILLVEQFRVGALGWRASPWCLELIAGIADQPGEAHDDLVRREAGEKPASRCTRSSRSATTCRVRVAATSVSACLSRAPSWPAPVAFTAMRMKVKTFAWSRCRWQRFLRYWPAACSIMPPRSSPCSGCNCTKAISTQDGARRADLRIVSACRP